MRIFGGIFLIAVFAWVAPASAAVPSAKVALTERLEGIRSRVMALEESLIDSLKTQKTARANLTKIQALMNLQQRERELGSQRIQELEKTIGELEARRGQLRERITIQQRGIRVSLRDLHRSMRESGRSEGASLPENEKVEAPRRKTLGNLVGRGLREIEALRADLADADHLEGRIHEEKHQLAYLFQDMKEQEGILELNRQLQVDLIEKKHAERLSQLENYRKLKSAEGQVERLIGEFTARMELAAIPGEFAKLKGRLALPISGKIVSEFGRSFDAKSNLHVFKKGVDIAAGKSEPVRAISSGKIAFAGELPNYGRIAIIDHGSHFYSLCGNLGEVGRKQGESIAAGEIVGLSDPDGAPVYFEIRARNIAVNPLQWISNSISLN